MAVTKKSDLLYLFNSHARNSLGIPDENGTVVVLKFSQLDEFQFQFQPEPDHCRYTCGNCCYTTVTQSLWCNNRLLLHQVFSLFPVALDRQKKVSLIVLRIS